MVPTSIYRIPIDGRWSLDDLYRFPRAFEQVYFALEAISPTSSVENEARIARAFAAYPWQGGYSAVSFYNHLKAITPPAQRPVINSIYYASPGAIELLLELPIAVQVGSVVTFVAGNLTICNRVYNKVMTDLQNRKLLRLEVERKQLELKRDEFKACLEMSDELAKVLNLDGIGELHERTRDPLKSVKILASVYRRVRILADFKNRKKANLRSIPELIRDGDFLD